MTSPTALRSQIAAEERYLAFLRSYAALPDDLQERFINFVLRCVPRPLETGAGDGMADGTGHTGDGSLDEAARDAIRESYRLHYEQIGSSLGSPPPEAPSIAGSSNGNGSAAQSGDGTDDPEHELERIREKPIRDLTSEEFDKLSPKEQRWTIDTWSEAQKEKRQEADPGCPLDLIRDPEFRAQEAARRAAA